MFQKGGVDVFVLLLVIGGWSNNIAVIGGMRGAAGIAGDNTTSDGTLEHRFFRHTSGFYGTPRQTVMLSYDTHLSNPLAS